MRCWLGVAGWAAAAVGIGLVAQCRRQLAWRGEEVARACHEVRGPLSAARLGLTLGQRLGRLEPSRLRALDQELERAARAIDDLEQSRRGSAAAQSEQAAVDIHRLLADSVSAWEASAAARDRGLRLRWSGSPIAVWGDRVRLAQALGNLIANAIEHGNGPVEVRGSASAETARIEVCDRGPGLEAPVADLIRRRRPWAPPRPRHRRLPRDRGRGLAIVSSIAAAHGGRLASAPSDAGARLVLTLPLRSKGSGLAQPSPGQSRLLSTFGSIYDPNRDS